MPATSKSIGPRFEIIGATEDSRIEPIAPESATVEFSPPRNVGLLVPMRNAGSS